MFMGSGSVFASSINSVILLVVTLMSFFLCFVMFSMSYVISYNGVVHYISHKNSSAETYAFILSAVTLLIIGVPSIELLYEYSSNTAVNLIIKVVGSQWYWSFEVSNLIEEAEVMYMLPLEELLVGNSRFLEVENRLVIPTIALIQFNITSSDVIHSFALPTMGAKVDATSGLLTVVPVVTSNIGVHYGQCSEMCGMNHSFIPFSLEVATFLSFFYWVIML